MFALPSAVIAVAGPTAASAAVAKVGLMATLKSVAFNALTNLAISSALSAFQPQVGMAGRTFEFVIDPDGPIPFAAGRVGVHGSVVHRDTFGPDLMYYGIVAVLSGAGPIDGFESFKADDETVSAFDANGKATSGTYANELWYKNKLGTQPDTALVSPAGLKNSAALPGWTTNHKLSGKASFLIVMGENSKQTAFPTGEIKPLVTLRGLKLWDPRLDSTWPGGSGSCRLDNPATWVYSTNPILWALKWSLGLWEDPTGKGAPQVGTQVGGIGAKLSGIDVPAFVSAANIADANGWTVSAYPNTDDDKAQVLDAFLQAGGCIYSQRAGKISCIQRAAPRTSIVTISARDTAGPLEIDTAASRIDRINTIRPRFWSEAHRWQLTAMPEISVSAYMTEDGAKRTRGIDFPFVNNSTQAGQLAALQIANTREGIAGVIPLKPHLQRIRPGDAFTITEEGFVLDGLKCLCLNTDYDPSTGVVRVSFVSETDGKYAFALGLTPDPPETQVLTPPDYTVTPPQTGEWTFTAEALTEGLGTIPALVFEGAVDNASAQQVIFETRVVDSPERPWAGAGVEDPNVIRKEVAGVTTGTVYEGAVSYRIGNRVSDRLVLGPVTAGQLVVITPAARFPVSRSVLYPTSATDDAITILAHDAVMPDGSVVSIPGGTVTGLDELIFYGVFWKSGVGFEVEASPATTHMSTGSWIFIGWQATADTATGETYPTTPTAPGGWGGGGGVPGDVISGETVETLYSLTGATDVKAQIAQATANAALGVADTADGGGTVSGSANAPAVNISGETWVAGAQVDLTSVVAGDLTMTGSGPQKDDDLVVTGSADFFGEVRAVEIDGLSETVVLSSTFRVSKASGVISGAFTSAFADFISARTSTGAISYRLDARRQPSTNSSVVESLALYVYARRAA